MRRGGRPWQLSPRGDSRSGKPDPRGGFGYPDLDTYVLELTIREADYQSSGPDSFSSTADILTAYARELETKISTGYRGRLEVTAVQVRSSGCPEQVRVLAVGDTIEFREAGPGTDPDASAIVDAIGDSGSVLLRFPGGSVQGYLPGVIELALATGAAIRNRR